ncbi:MAG: MarR family transcriptional regulator [Oscillospiraceae bacterium]|jgi:DNA-binding MarR family transcriptional regulator|nr:MarR family transcriptional regulator [Oscillospiraceae bacterium]
MNIGELFLNVMSEFYENDSRARTFGTDTELYHSEIHMLQCIAENPELHISGLARLLGVTRGAASQTAMRLERKGMIVKQASPDDNKKVVLQLTRKGQTAATNHKNAHEKYNALISDILSGSDAAQLQFLTDFLIRFEQSMKEE